MTCDLDGIKTQSHCHKRASNHPRTPVHPNSLSNMKTTRSFRRHSAVLLLASSALLVPSAESFSVRPNPSSRAPSHLGVNTHLETSATTTRDKSLSWIDLPSKSSRQQERLDGLELIVGRVAIVGAAGIIIKELVTGESILDQCHDALQQCLASL